MCGYDQGRYKDQSIGDTPKIYTIAVEGKDTKVVGAGCKNGGFYVLKADDGQIVAQTPVFAGPPNYPLSPQPAKRMITLPGIMGGLQTGCATDGKAVFTNGIDMLGLGTAKDKRYVTPTGGRVVSLSLDTRVENWAALVTSVNAAFGEFLPNSRNSTHCPGSSVALAGRSWSSSVGR